MLQRFRCFVKLWRRRSILWKFGAGEGCFRYYGQILVQSFSILQELGIKLELSEQELELVQTFTLKFLSHVARWNINSIKHVDQCRKEGTLLLRTKYLQGGSAPGHPPTKRDGETSWRDSYSWKHTPLSTICLPRVLQKEEENSTIPNSMMSMSMVCTK